MREVDACHTLWLEPDSFRNFSLASPLLDEAFPDDRVVYCPHSYPFLMSGDRVEEWRDQLTDSYAGMRAEADSWGAALVVGEWGADPREPAQYPYIQAAQELAEDVGAGRAFWVWKEISQGFWGFYDRDGAIDAWTLRAEGAGI